MPYKLLIVLSMAATLWACEDTETDQTIPLNHTLAAEQESIKLTTPWVNAAPLPTSNHINRQLQPGQEGIWMAQHTRDRIVLHQRIQHRWERRTTPAGEHMFADVQLVEQHTGDLWMATKDHLWRSEDQAQTWRDADVPWKKTDTIERFWAQQNELHALIHPADQHNKAQLWRHDGQRWSLVHTKAFMIVDYVPLPNVLLHSMQYGWLMSSRDEGKTWQQIEDGPNGVMPPKLLTTTHHVFAFSDRGIWRSDLDAQRWEKLHDDVVLNATLHQDTLYFVSASQQMFALQLKTLQIQPLGELHQLRNVIANERGVFAQTPTQLYQQTARGDWAPIETPTPQVVKLAMTQGTLFALNETGQVFELPKARQQWVHTQQGQMVRDIYANDEHAFLLKHQTGVLVSRRDKVTIDYPMRGQTISNQSHMTMLIPATQSFLELDQRTKTWSKFGPQVPLAEPGEALTGMKMDTNGEEIVVYHDNRVWRSTHAHARWNKSRVPTLPCSSIDHYPVVDDGAPLLWSSTTCGVFETHLHSGETSLLAIPKEALVVHHVNIAGSTWVLTARHGIWSRSHGESEWTQRASVAPGQARFMLIDGQTLWVATTTGIFQALIERF